MELNSRENCQRKRHCCSYPLGSDHLRQAEKGQRELAASNSYVCVTTKKKKKCWLLSASHLCVKSFWSETIQTVHRDITISKSQHKWNNWNEKSSLESSPVQLSIIFPSCSITQFSSVRFDVLRRSISSMPHTRTTKVWLLQFKSKKKKKNTGHPCVEKVLSRSRSNSKVFSSHTRSIYCVCLYVCMCMCVCACLYIYIRCLQLRWCCSYGLSSPEYWWWFFSGVLPGWHQLFANPWKTIKQ